MSFPKRDGSLNDVTIKHNFIIAFDCATFYEAIP